MISVTWALVIPMPKSRRVIPRRLAHPSSKICECPFSTWLTMMSSARAMCHIEPRQRVEILARAHAHLLVAQAAEGPLRRRHFVAGDGGRVHRGVLIQEQVTSVHGVPSSAEDSARGRWRCQARRWIYEPCSSTRSWPCWPSGP